LIKQRATEIRAIKEKADKLELDRLAALEKAAGMSSADAKAEIVKKLEKQNEEDFMARAKKLENQGEEMLESKAKDILAVSIQRLASSVASDFMSSTVEIPSDDVKGKNHRQGRPQYQGIRARHWREVLVDDTQEPSLSHLSTQYVATSLHRPS